MGDSPLQLDRRDPSTPLMVLPDGRVSATYGQWFAHAKLLSEHLAEGTRLICGTDDRYLAMVALLGSWICKGSLVLPANLTEGALSHARAQGGIVVTRAPSPDALNLGGLVGDAGNAPAPAPQLRLAPADELLRVYTSGTTGEPVAVAKSARQLLAEPPVIARLLKLDARDRVLVTAPVSHVYGLVVGHLSAVQAGASTVAADLSWPGHLERVAASSGATLWVTVPAHLAMVSQSRGALPRPTRIVCAGSRLTPAIATALSQKGYGVREIFGSTETGAFATRVVGEEPPDAPEPPWTSLPGVALKTDEDGRLLVRSPFNPQVDTFALLGDSAQMLPDGSFRHLGRHDGVLKIGSKRLSLQRLEGLVIRMTGARDAAALCVDVPGVRHQTAWLAVESDSLTDAEVKAALAAQLDPVTMPRRVRIIPVLPRDHRGKLNRGAIKALFD